MMPAFPDEAEIRDVCAMTDASARNLRITDCYSRLSGELARRVGPGANWCTFATWASNQAGVTIRKDDLVEALRHRLRASERFTGLVGRLLRQLEQTQVDLVDDVLESVSSLGPLERSSAAVGKGNLKVYEEIGLEFSRFLTRFADVAAITDTELDRFRSGLRDGDPPDGQARLREAFGDYRSAARASSSKECAEWLLLANLRIGLHEQIRLQPDILEAMDGAVLEPGDLTDLLLKKIAERDDRGHGVARSILHPDRAPARLLARALADEVRAVVREIVTEHLMTLTLAGDVVRLGTDLTRPYPADLSALTNPALVALLARADPNLGSREGSGAQDWSNLAQRMQFIANLFRAYHEDARLFRSPLP